MDKTKIAFVSLGCDKNLVDSEIMLGIINENGYIITQDEDEADVIIVNTCGFKLDATEEGVNNILELAEYKENGNCKGLIVTGCMAQRYKSEIMDQMPEVDAVVGTGDFDKIAEVIKDVEEGKKVTLITDINRSLAEELSHKRMVATPQHFAYLKIAEGCDNKCTYCTIPSLRGAYRSRTMDSLVKEAEILAKNGAKELIVIAQDTAVYGKDIYGESRLHQLLERLESVEGIEWIRVLYAYPEHITDNLIAEFKRNKKLAHYLDMPIQHTEDDVLRKMARRSRREDLKTLINKIRKEVPDFIFRTTLIVGFPGETQENFDSMVEFIEEMEFDKIGVFTYSAEEGTPAATMDNQVDEEVKVERKEYILQVQQNVSARKSMDYVGKTFDVMVDGKLPEEDVYVGRSYMDCYEIDGMVFFKADYDIMSGDIVQVKITESLEYDLKGEII